LWFLSVANKKIVEETCERLGAGRFCPALDAYSWLAHRLCRVPQAKGVNVPWLALKAQFGQEYRNLDDFRKEFRSALEPSKGVL
jgi:hypothetical protein